VTEPGWRQLRRTRAYRAATHRSVTPSRRVQRPASAHRRRVLHSRRCRNPTYKAKLRHRSSRCSTKPATPPRAFERATAGKARWNDYLARCEDRRVQSDGDCVVVHAIRWRVSVIRLGRSTRRQCHDVPAVRATAQSRAVGTAQNRYTLWLGSPATSVLCCGTKGGERVGGGPSIAPRNRGPARLCASTRPSPGGQAFARSPSCCEDEPIQRRVARRGRGP
jgi:hypothetical protein